MPLFSRDGPVDWSQQDNPFREALCRKFGIPLRTYDPWFDDQAEALQICNGESGGPVCPMRQRCLKRALLNNEAHGVWGGMLLHDRKALKKAHPDDPEAWLWHPPTVPAPKATKEKPDPLDLAPSPSSWTTGAPRPWFSATYAPTSWPVPENRMRTEMRASYTPARSARTTGVPEPRTGTCAAV